MSKFNLIKFTSYPLSLLNHSILRLSYCIDLFIASFLHALGGEAVPQESLKPTACCAIFVDDVGMKDARLGLIGFVGEVFGGSRLESREERSFLVLGVKRRGFMLLLLLPSMKLLST